MSLTDHYVAFARYNAWMNRRLFDLCSERLTDARRKEDRGAFFGSIHGTFNHILLADRTWMGRLTGDRERFASRDAHGEIIQITSLAQELYADWDELRRERERTDADIEAWVSALEPGDLGATLRYANSKGERFEHPTWWAVSHLFNHQTHHRGQITTVMYQLGVDPGVTDLAMMLREQGQPA